MFIVHWLVPLKCHWIITELFGSCTRHLVVGTLFWIVDILIGVKSNVYHCEINVEYSRIKCKSVPFFQELMSLCTFPSISACYVVGTIFWVVRGRVPRPNCISDLLTIIAHIQYYANIFSSTSRFACSSVCFCLWLWGSARKWWSKVHEWGGGIIRLVGK